MLGGAQNSFVAAVQELRLRDPGRKKVKADGDRVLSGWGPVAYFATVDKGLVTRQDVSFGD